MTQLFTSAANSRLMAGGLVGSTSQLGGMKAAAALPGRQEKTESGWLKRRHGEVVESKRVFPKIGGNYPPNHPWINRDFHDFHHPFWGTTILGNTHIVPYSRVSL